MILKDFPIISFDGGVVRNKSSYAMKKNELLSAYNVEIDELGRVIRRRGNQHYGSYLAHKNSAADVTPAGAENSFSFAKNAVSAASSTSMLVNDNATSGVVVRIIGSRLAGAITSASTTIDLISSSDFATGVTAFVEIEGDLITYTGVNANQLTGVTGITSSHAIGVPVHTTIQITQPSTAFDFTQGGYYAIADSSSISWDNCFVSSRNVLDYSASGGNFSGTPIKFTDGATPNVGVLFLVNYRDRFYGAGSGASATLTIDGANRVFYSALGDGTSWTMTNYFDIKDQSGDITSGLKVFNDVLNIFKRSSFYSYNQVSLKKRSSIVGAYNNKVIQEVNGLMYTFCPSGIWITNGISHRKISKPVEEYIKNFKPQFDDNTRVITNTFAFKYGDNYCVYLGNITKPETQSNVILVYNTIKKNWSVFFTDIQWLHANSFSRYLFGGRLQETEGVFAGSVTSGTPTYRFWKLFSNEHLNGAGNSFGGDLKLDTFFNTGVDIAAHFETPLYDLATPQYIKKFKYIRGLSEVVGWNAEYRIEDKVGVSGYKPIGQFQRPNQRLAIPNTPLGYRIG